MTFMRAGRLYHTRARMMLPNNISKTYSIKSFRRVTFLEGLLNLESHQHQGRSRKNRRGTPGQLIRSMGCPCFKNLVRLPQGCKRPSLSRTYTILKNMIQSTSHPPQWSNFTVGKSSKLASPKVSSGVQNGSGSIPSRHKANRVPQKRKCGILIIDTQIRKIKSNQGK